MLDHRAFQAIDLENKLEGFGQDLLKVVAHVFVPEEVDLALALTSSFDPLEMEVDEGLQVLPGHFDQVVFFDGFGVDDKVVRPRAEEVHLGLDSLDGVPDNQDHFLYVDREFAVVKWNMRLHQPLALVMALSGHLSADHETHCQGQRVKAHV